jgi:hypothetical protein
MIMEFKKKEGFEIWPIHYEDDKTKYRVVSYKDNKVVYEAIFATIMAAEDHIRVCSESE